MRARAVASLAATLASSLPTVVGLAVWPWVRDSIGTAANSRAIAVRVATRPSSAGSSTCSRAAFNIKAWLVLLMSSLVHAKCTNSPAARNSGWPSKRALSQYSTALTSWLVVFSMSLMACASPSEKRSTRPRNRPRAASLRGLNSANPASDNAMNHSTST